MKKSITMPLGVFTIDSGMSLTKIRVLAALLALAKNGVVYGYSQREIASVVGLDAVRAHMTIKAMCTDGTIAAEHSGDGLKTYTIMV
jgi:hypothetical protein